MLFKFQKKILMRNGIEGFRKVQVYHVGLRSQRLYQRRTKHQKFG